MILRSLTVLAVISGVTALATPAKAPAPVGADTPLDFTLDAPAA